MKNKALWAAMVLFLGGSLLFAQEGKPGAKKEEAAAAATPQANVDYRAKFDQAIALMKKDNLLDARPLFEEVKNSPNEQLRDQSYMWLGHISESRDQIQKAVSYYFELATTTKIPVYKTYASMQLYYLKQKLSSRGGFDWLPARGISRFYLMRASTSPASFKYYIFNLPPMILMLIRLLMFLAFAYICRFMATFEMFQRTSFKIEEEQVKWTFKGIIWLYILFTFAQTMVFYPFHGSRFFMENIDKGLYVESILQMAMLAVMSLFFFMVKGHRLRDIFIGEYKPHMWTTVLLKYLGFIIIVTGFLGFVSRYELFGYARAARNYEFNWGGLVEGTGLLKTILVVIMAPICEEIFYRGVILTALAKFFGPLVAIFLASLIFTAVHLNPQGYPVIFVMAFFLGQAYLRTRGLMFPILIHFSYNLITVLDILRFI